MTMRPDVPVQTDLRRGGWALILRGLAALGFGLFALAHTDAAAGVFVVIFAVFAFADAILELFVAGTLGRVGTPWGWYVVAAVLSIAAGVIALAYPRVTVLVLVLLVAARAIVMGFAEIGAAVSWSDPDRRWLLAVTGVLSVILGVLLFASPDTGGATLIGMVGVYGVVLGVALGVLGLRLVRDHHDLAAMTTPSR
jgi:uncharacterized membrane protein HdeD (DUF308 family)